LVLLEEVDADVSLVDLCAADYAHLRVHHDVVGDRQRLKCLPKVVYLLSVVLVQHLLLLCPKTRGDKPGLVKVQKLTKRCRLRSIEIWWRFEKRLRICQVLKILSFCLKSADY
jgi:hypothetical protein